MYELEMKVYLRMNKLTRVKVIEQSSLMKKLFNAVIEKRLSIIPSISTSVSYVTLMFASTNILHELFFSKIRAYKI